MKCRKNVKNLTDDEKKRYVNAFVALKSQDSVIHPGAQSRYDDFVETHLNAMMATVGWAHQDSVFFPWHRELLYQFEKLLQTVDPTVTIPYWDWTRDQNSGAAGFPFKHTFIGVDGDDADSDRVKRDPAAPAVDATHPYIYPFDPIPWSNSVVVTDGLGDINFFQRQFGERSDAPNLPRNDSLVTGVSSTFRQAIGATDYLTLRPRSEDIHNLVHRWVGGNMLRMTSPNDPVFFMHHANIDRMWSIWQKKVAPGTQFYQQSSTAAGHKLNDAMIFNDVDPAPFPTGTTIAQVIDGHAMHGVGVWYQSDIPELTNDTGPNLVFTNIPEGLTSYKAVKFKIKGCRPVHFRITGSPTGQFGLVDMNGMTNVTEFIANPVDADDFFYGYVWVKLVAVAGAIAPSGVDIHAYIIDEEGYYAATEGGEYPLGDFHVTLTATSVAREDNSVALVLDRSGSMSDPAGGTSTKSELLGNAIQVFRDLMLANDEVAVVTFDDVVATPVPMQHVSAAPAFSTIDITPRNTTWIGGGIQQGAVQLAAATHTNKSMIVLTDGNENVHPYIGELPTSTITNRTYAIGFGLPGDVSDAALQQITSNTHGDLIITGNISTDEQRFNLTKYFVQVLAGVTRMDVILDPQSSLFRGSIQTIPFHLSDTDVYADLITLCPIPKLINFYLETPDGHIIKPSTATAEPNIKYVMGQQVVFYRIVLPALAADAAGSHAGNWKAILSVKSDAQLKKLADDRTVMEGMRTNAVRESLPYSFVAHAYSNLRLSACKQQESLKPGSAVTLFASLKEYDVALQTEAVVWAQVTKPDQGTFDLKLPRTDAATYSGSFNTSLAGVYACRLRAEGLTSKGLPFSREQTLSAGVYYGNYEPVPQPKPNEAICHLIECFLSEKVLSPAAIRRFSELGIDMKHLRECISKTCADKTTERIPDLIYKAFIAARKKQLRATPTLNLKKAATPKPLKLPVKPVRKIQPEKEFVTMFMPIKDDLIGRTPRRKAGSKNKRRK
jgi:Common central domain of tyrosinase/von Willebrand factor type A domain